MRIALLLSILLVPFSVYSQTRFIHVLMCPEAYTLDAAIDSWIINDTPGVTREKAAQAYHQYQKCGVKGARNLLVTGY